jgi:hypothetical protein
MPLGMSRKTNWAEIKWGISTADDMNLLGDNVDTIKKNTGTL